MPPGSSPSRRRCRVPAGLVAVICVVRYDREVRRRVVPKSTAVAPVKPVPVIVTGVPPATGPLVGLMPVTVGARRGVRELIGRGGRATCRPESSPSRPRRRCPRG